METEVLVLIQAAWMAVAHGEKKGLGESHQGKPILGKFQQCKVSTSIGFMGM